MKIKIKFVIYGNSDISLHFASAIMQSNYCELLAIVTLEKELLPLNSLDLSIFSSENNIECIKTSDINSRRTKDEIQCLNPDIAVSSWPHLIKQELLEIVNMFTIGTHPANLPLNRGRHPLHWFICLNSFETVLSFFKMGIGLDDGDIILREMFSITTHSNINDFNKAMSQAAFNGMKKICKDISNGSVNFTPQNNLESTYFRKRNFFDTLLDLRMSVKSIINHVNSFCEPYHCASLIIEKSIYYIKKAEVISKNENIVEYGKVFCMSKNTIDIQVEDSLIRFYFRDESECIDGLEYVYSPTYYYNKYNEYYKEKFNEY